MQQQASRRAPSAMWPKGQKRTLAGLRKKRTKELRRACATAAPTRTTKAAKRKQCGHWKSRSHVTGLSNKGSAESVPRSAKACQQCGRLAQIRPALGATAAPSRGQGGCGHARPRKSVCYAKKRPAWVCDRCAAKSSQCRGDLPKTANADSWCDSCAFPPCQGGCGRARPRRGERHANGVLLAQLIKFGPSFTSKIFGLGANCQQNGFSIKNPIVC